MVRSGSSGATTQSLHAPSRWILTPWQDLVLFVGTPLLIIPAFLAAQARWRVEDLSLFVASFGAIGHHLPGMLRAYGDRALFQRFRWRFSIAPMFLAATCLLFALRDLNGIVLVVYLWGVWHGLMQTYGFVRIYDAKAGPSSPWTARLDHAMCVTWFATAVLVSPSRMTNILSVLYTSGGALIEASTIEALRATSIYVTGAVTAAFLLHAAWMWRRGQPPSQVKLLLMATSFGFFWYTNVLVSNMLAGIALFEVFHDVQYLSIVWIYNLNRVQKDRGVGAFTRFLFRRSGALVGVYVGLVVAYGSLNLVSTAMSTGLLKRMLTGLLAASALLHFYYDGFIWKVRERTTRQSLGLSGGSPDHALNVQPGWLIHAAKWSLFVLPVAMLGFAEVQGRAPELDRARAIAQAVPTSALAQEHFGVLLAGAGRSDEAVARLREAVRLDPNNAEAQSNLGVKLAQLGRLTEAVTHYREAIRIEPGDALTQTNLGNALSRLGEFPEAIRHFEEAPRISPNRVDAHIDLGAALLRQGALDEAIDHFREVLRISPNQPQALANLALARELRDRRRPNSVDPEQGVPSTSRPPEKR
ncbi:MAG: tetratricopeptide repeat protein [Acidobacteria bacterium]|nr:tetratricopeptide repeat protein [Acidobacteriota bacterium]